VSNEETNKQKKHEKKKIITSKVFFSVYLIWDPSTDIPKKKSFLIFFHKQKKIKKTKKTKKKLCSFSQEAI
jgi:hypothetical protein